MDRNKVGLVGLLETRVKATSLGSLYLAMFKGWCFTSNIAWHKGGRITVTWDPQAFRIRKIIGHSQFIHLEVTMAGTEENFDMTIIYAYNKELQRRSLWRELKVLHTSKPWLVAGDFNEILNMEERIGRRAHGMGNEDFRNCIKECGLEDITYSTLR